MVAVYDIHCAGRGRFCARCLPVFAPFANTVTQEGSGRKGNLGKQPIREVMPL